MPRNSKGYTFIELSIVILLIGLMCAIAIPRFRYAILTDNLKKTTRQMVGIIKNLRTEAIREQKVYILRFDLKTNSYRIESPAMTEEERMTSRERAIFLPADVRILDIQLNGKRKKMSGEVTIRFNKKGYVQQSAIHLGADDGRKFTLVLSPFLGSIKVLEKYREFENKL